jgi:ABC-2 type transport system permease protein
VVEAIRLYATLATAEQRSAWQHRGSFAFLAVAGVAMTLLDFVAIVFLLQQVPRLAGLTLGQLAVVYGLASTCERTADLLVGDVDKVADLVRLGTFDKVLVRPGPALVQVAATSFRPQVWGRPLQGVVVLAIALDRAHVPWTWDRVLLVPLTIVVGTTIFIAVWVAGAALTFATVDGKEAMNAFTYGGGFVAQHPLPVYATWFRRLFTYVVPMAFVSWVPTCHLLGIADPLHLPAALGPAGPLAAAAAVAVAAVLWRGAVRRHRSTGS